jgi:hypothetical protein
LWINYLANVAFDVGLWLWGVSDKAGVLTLGGNKGAPREQAIVVPTQGDSMGLWTAWRLALTGGSDPERQSPITADR